MAVLTVGRATRVVAAGGDDPTSASYDPTTDHTSSGEWADYSGATDPGFAHELPDWPTRWIITS